MLTEKMIKDGWIAHTGGPCPVPLDSEVTTLTPLQLRLPYQYPPIKSLAGREHWPWDGKLPTSLCIIAYKPEAPAMQNDVREVLDIDAAIADAWPERWAKANDSRPGASKRRNKIRGYWRGHLAFEAFKAANPNARCGNCNSYKPMPHSDKMHCEAESDFYGYQTATADGLCMKWKIATAALKAKEQP